MVRPPRRILVTYGTRPEIIKLAPVIARLRSTPGLAVRIVATGQHRELARLAQETFGLEPDLDLDVMQAGQSPSAVQARVLELLGQDFARRTPDLVVVQGDTTTTLAAALAAFYRKIPVAHVEAGLRSHRRYAPFPEEMNRRLVSVIASLHFVPTRRNLENLTPEVVGDALVFVTGNPVLDALAEVARHPGTRGVRERLGIPSEGELLLVTVHRRESWGEGIRSIAKALASLLDRRPGVRLAVVLHPNPEAGGALRSALEGHERCHLLEALGYSEFVGLMRSCRLVLTDSGGLQEEAPFFDKPVVVLRSETDRPEAIEAGTAVLAGTAEEGILRETVRLLESESEYRKRAQSPNPYGDGRASERIAQGILSFFGRSDPPAPPPVSGGKDR
jgi:UDP-N-acetylglucosamine 2-epimerase (non-hydrolysing)